MESLTSLRVFVQLFLKAHVNTSEMTDIIIQQNHVGSVIKVSESHRADTKEFQFQHAFTPPFPFLQQAEVPEDSDDDDPDEVFGFITMLNLTERKVGAHYLAVVNCDNKHIACGAEVSLCAWSYCQSVQCVEEVKELIVDQCEKTSTHSMSEQLEQILNDTSKPVGLLLSERFINVPPQIALPLHKQLQ